MIRVNILSGTQKQPFFAHWDKERFPETKYCICENSEADLVWDVVVVYENIPCRRSIRCRAGGLVYVSGEPPMMRPLPDAFLAQFDEVVVPNLKSRHPHKLLSHGFLNWSLGVDFKTKEHKYDFNQLRNLESVKTKNISIVTSNKRMMPGHNRRMKIIENLCRDFPGQIDLYGFGHNFVNYKADALLPYRFHICMENSAIPYYWTEKLSDPVLANCIPIYLGCTNIDRYFDSRGFITFAIEDYDALKSLICDILDEPERMYQKYYSYMRANRRLLMDKENLIPFVIQRYATGLANSYKTYEIKPLADYRAFHYMFYAIRLRRLMYKLYYTLFKNKWLGKGYSIF